MSVSSLNYYIKCLLAVKSSMSTLRYILLDWFIADSLKFKIKMNTKDCHDSTKVSRRVSYALHGINSFC